MKDFEILKEEAKKYNLTLTEKHGDFYLSEYTNGMIRQGKLKTLDDVKNYLQKKGLK